MTDVQAACISPMLSGQDLIAQSQTGSGKTAAFLIPLLQKIKGYEAFPQGMILCPTRELCEQVLQECKKFAKYLESLKVVSLVGGQPIIQQMEALKKGAQLIVGTPGRTLELIKQGKADVTKLKVLVLDEADRLLEEGFADEMKAIIAKLPKARQTVFFSATFPVTITELSRQYQRKPKIIKIENPLKEMNSIKSFIYQVEKPEKTRALVELLNKYHADSTIVFCRTKLAVDEIVTALAQVQLESKGLHSDLSQAERDLTTASFRSGQLKILVATDLAARGLDMESLKLVINFDFPANTDSYIHRAGRVGRAGRSGSVISLVTNFETELISAVEKEMDLNFIRISDIES